MLLINASNVWTFDTKYKLELSYKHVKTVFINEYSNNVVKFMDFKKN